MSQQTALHDVHVALGATFTDFAGWQMPLRYTSDIAEHHAVRSAAGIFDLSHMGEIEVSGGGAAAQLDGALVGNISAIAPGRAKYTMLCDHDGGIIDDLVVYRTGEYQYMIVANAANAATVLAHLRERIDQGQARVDDASLQWCLIAVQGPAAKAIVEQATGTALDALKYYAVMQATIAGAHTLLARTGYTGEDGFEVYCRPESAAAIWQQLASIGAPHGITPTGLACRDSLRLEAAMPLYGQELTREVTPFEAGLGRVVGKDKHIAFVGQGALSERARTGASVALVGLRAAGRRSPRTGYDVVDALTERPIGHVTSGIPSPTLGYPIAMAYVPIAHSAIGHEVAVDIRGTLEPHTVTPLPFYRRAR